ncbi:MAG TPA: DUF6325 family protein [Kineosporiaceae bacterium]|nr:DUF6325 family protein [Kineosporiaceae bacterium]
MRLDHRDPARMARSAWASTLAVKSLGGDDMTAHVQESPDELGPVDWMVQEFPGRRFNGETAPALNDLVEKGMVHVLDLLLIRKEDVGGTAAVPVGENLWAAPLGSSVRHTGVHPVAAGRDSCPGDHRCVSRRPRPRRPTRMRRTKRTSLQLSCRTRRARPSRPRGRLSEVPLAARPARRATMIGPAPVARTATTVGTAAVVAHGVARRTDRREDRREDRRDRRF